MEENQHFGILCFIISRKVKLMHTRKDLCSVGKNVTDWTCQRWFVKCHAGNFSLDDAPWLGRPVEVHSYQTETLRAISVIPHGMIINILRISKSSVKKITCTNLVMLITNVLVPHKLSEENKPSWPYFHMWFSIEMQWKHSVFKTNYDTQYVNKPENSAVATRLEKVSFHFKSQRKVMQKNVQTTAQLHSFHMLAR